MVAATMVDRMRADDEADRQRFAARRARLIDRAQIARRDEVDAGLVPAAQHQPAHADIGLAGAGRRVVDRRRNIGRAVEAVLEMDRQRREVGVSPISTTCCTGASARVDLDQLRRRRRRRWISAAICSGATPKARARRERLPTTLPTSSTSGPTCGTDRLRIAVQDRGDVGEIDRVVAHVELVVAELLDEIAQTETVEIARRRRACLVCLLDDVHVAVLGVLARDCTAISEPMKSIRQWTSRRGPTRASSITQRLSSPGSTGRSSNHRTLGWAKSQQHRSHRGYWIARSSRAMTAQ